MNLLTEVFAKARFKISNWYQPLVSSIGIVNISKLSCQYPVILANNKVDFVSGASKPNTLLPKYIEIHKNILESDNI